MKRPPIRRANKRREPPLPALVCGVIIVVDAWLIGWWTVPIAALIVGAIWRNRGDAAIQAMWGAVGAWALLLLIDSLHGRSWALARAAGGAVFLPWGLLFPATLLFAAGLAWSAAVVAQALTGRLVREDAA